jgi:hypothetical protein
MDDSRLSQRANVSLDRLAARSNDVTDHLIQLAILASGEDVSRRPIAQRAGQRVLPLPDLPEPARLPHKLADARDALLFVGAQRGSNSCSFTAALLRAGQRVARLG